MRTLLVVSPHLDDAVLSCAGAIHAAVQRGDRVVVATVFSEGHDHARRRAEDRAALAELGASALHLGLDDAPERLGLARTHRALVEEAALDEADVALARQALEDVLARLAPSQVWAPLAVGDHVDHQVVHAALRRCAEVVFYEERPYAFLAGATRAHLLARGDAADGPDLAAPPDARRMRDQLDTLPHLRAFLATDEDGARARTWLASRIASDGACSKATRSGSVLTAKVTPYDVATARAATRAITAYSSQIEALFGGARGVAPALEAAARALWPADAAAPAPPHAERTFTPTRACP